MDQDITLHEATDEQLLAELHHRLTRGVPADVLDMPAGAELGPHGDPGEQGAEEPERG